MAILDRNQAIAQCLKWRESGETIVFTNGCFDILHAGHIHNLNRCKSFGQKLVVGLNTDASVQNLKGKSRPIIPENDRAAILEALTTVDLVVMFDEETPRELIQELRPHILVKGNDYSEEEIAGAEEVLSWGGRVEQIALKPGYSTSSIIKRIQSLDS